jgi:hypothetical protein
MKNGSIETLSSLIRLVEDRCISNKFSKDIIDKMFKEDVISYFKDSVDKQKEMGINSIQLVFDNFEQLDSDYKKGGLNIEKKLGSILSKQMFGVKPFEEYSTSICVSYGIIDEYINGRMVDGVDENVYCFLEEIKDKKD